MERGIPEDNRPLATYICGNPGSGKSSLLQHMILRDIELNRPVCVIDPNFQLINTVLSRIPEWRKDDVIYYYPEMGIPIDFFSADEANRNQLIDDLVNIIDLSDAKTAKEYLANAITALFEANKKRQPDDRYTLFDSLRICQNDNFKEQVLQDCPAHIASLFPSRYNSESVNALITRMSKLAREDLLRSVINAKSPKFNPAKIIDENKILLIKLKENSEPHAIIGSIIAAKIQHAIFSRMELDDIYTAKPYYLYIDECDAVLKFAEARFITIIKRARKCKLVMTIACPEPGDLPEGIRNGLGKIGNLVIFNLADATMFKTRIAPHFRPDFCASIPPFHALLVTNNRVHPVETPGYLTAIKNDHARYAEDSTKKLYACKSPSIPHTSDNGNALESDAGNPQPPQGVPISHASAGSPDPQKSGRRDRETRGAEKPDPPRSRGKS